MTKNDLLHVIKEEYPSIPIKDIDGILKTYTVIIADMLIDGEPFTIPNLVTLKPVVCKERQGRNPQTGETITIPAQRRVKVIMSKTLKELMNNES